MQVSKIGGTGIHNDLAHFTASRIRFRDRFCVILPLFWSNLATLQAHLHSFSTEDTLPMPSKLAHSCSIVNSKTH